MSILFLNTSRLFQTTSLSIQFKSFPYDSHEYLLVLFLQCPHFFIVFLILSLLLLGWEETRSFMNQVQTVVNYWMVNTSYSVGVSDTVADASTINTIQATLDEAKKKVSLRLITATTIQMPCFKSRIALYLILSCLILSCLSDHQVDAIMARGQQGLLEMQPGKPLMESFEVSRKPCDSTYSTVQYSAVQYTSFLRSLQILNLHLNFYYA